MNTYPKLIVILCCTLIGACSGGKQSPIGFSLPEGDPAAGKSAFVDLACIACHSTPDIEQLESAPGDISVALGGDVTQVKTYADLVTSVINPSHRISKSSPPGMLTVDGKSRMRNYNSVMTVEQLVNVVAYLQPHYKLRPFERIPYRNYHP
jgi:sulfur-oxidizing protein SoxX